MSVVIEPFRTLVKLTARLFYDSYDGSAPKGGDNPQPKSRRSDKGIAVMVLDALTRRQCVGEEDLAKGLKLNSRQVGCTLRFLEKEKLVTRDQIRKETAKTGLKIHNVAAVAAAMGVVAVAVAGEEKVKKVATVSYCCLDYAQIHDVVRYRLHRMSKKLKDYRLEDKRNTVQEYVCPNYERGRRYNALDALHLLSIDDEYFHCERCDGVLEPAAAEIDDKLAASQDDILQKMEVQLKRLMEQLNRLKNLAAPEFESLQAWEARERSAAAHGENGESSAIEPSKSSHGGTKVKVVDCSGVEGKGKDVKVFPPWMIKQEMNITKEQRGDEVKREAKIDPEFSEDKKNTESNENNLLHQYLKEYYAALIKRQEEEEAKKQQESYGPSGMSPNRQVGMKSQRDEDEGEDHVNWEEAPITGNFEANATEDNVDGINWD